MAVGDPSSVQRIMEAVSRRDVADVAAGVAGASGPPSSSSLPQGLTGPAPVTPYSPEPGARAASVSSAVRAWIRKPGVLLWCSLAGLLRNPSLLLMHYAGAALMGLLVGFVFFHVEVESTAGRRGSEMLFCASCLPARLLLARPPAACPLHLDAGRRGRNMLRPQFPCYAPCPRPPRCDRAAGDALLWCQRRRVPRAERHGLTARRPTGMGPLPPSPSSPPPPAGGGA